MPAGSVEKTNARKEEIVNACEKLYQTMSFKEITLKDISRETSFSRTSIYNYFQTKEEIFLALLKREYDEWIKQLQEKIDASEKMSDDEIAECLAQTLNDHQQLLKILSMNHYDLEENSRMDLLVEFKRSYGNALQTVDQLLEKFRMDMDHVKREAFVYSFFPFMFGIYPYTVVTEKQKEAMKKAGVNYIYSSVYDLTFTTVKRLLSIVYSLIFYTFFILFRLFPLFFDVFFTFCLFS